MYPHRFPAAVIQRDGPFDEFAKDASIVTVELNDGSVISPVLLVYPDFVGGMPDVDGIPFDPRRVLRIYQTPENLNQCSRSHWTFFTSQP